MSVTIRSDADTFDRSLGCLVSPALDELAVQLSTIATLPAREREVVLVATREALLRVLHGKLSRLLIVELHAARVQGRLRGEDSTKRWEHFLELSSHQIFWESLSAEYPSLLSRVAVILKQRCAASFQFATHWTADRTLFDNDDPGELLELRFGAGDSHREGQTVAILRCDAGRLAYKPRSVAVDIALKSFLVELAEDHGTPWVISVPRAWGFEEHGWVEFIEHRYAVGAEELENFYRGIGHWLAVMRLLAGSDLHAENLIAHGSCPVVVDCETLFGPKISSSPSGYGDALDQAAGLVAGTVLNIGLLPGRGLGLGWRGVDNSAAGMLPDQQPMMLRPTIINAGTDEARIGTELVAMEVSQNHPSPRPALAKYWPKVLEGFNGMTDTLRSLDAAGVLRARLERFANCRIRVVPRSTEAYAEISRMLWHPISLHQQEPARQRGCELLRTMARNVSSAPNDPAVINAEIDNLMEGNIPVFSTLVKDGRLEGPGLTSWLPPCNLIDSSLQQWRTADFDLERKVIRASLVSAYVNDGWMPAEGSFLPEQVRPGNLENRRRGQAAQIVSRIVHNAILGKDGSVEWIAPVLNQTGCSVQPLQQDVYNGISGLALVLGGYRCEMQSGRANRVDGVEDLFDRVMRTLDMFEAKHRKLRGEGIKVRPPTPGAYIGIASQIWTYLVLEKWRIDDGEGLERACALAGDLPEAAERDEVGDLLSGTAGAIVPLLALAQRTGQDRYMHLASTLGDRLCQSARRMNGCAFWSQRKWPEGMGGFAHGVTGVGWALAKLGVITGVSTYLEISQEAFAFEDALYSEEEQNWLDLRLLEVTRTAAAWCHGSVGIGLARLNLDPTLSDLATRTLLRRAAEATWRQGLGWNHCACHGDWGAWELLEAAITKGEGPGKITVTELRELMVTSLEDNGPICGLTREAFIPGLMPGLGGVAYQLLRMHPTNSLPSILIPGDGVLEV